MKTTPYIMIIILPLILNSANAAQDAVSNQLFERIQAMEERIATLESRFTFTSFMPDFAERFHVLHRAAESNDWAVASHELQEMKNMIDSSITIDESKGLLFQAMMGPVMTKMEGAIGQGDEENMHTLIHETVQICNSCHVATGSAFIKVTLDASEVTSIRHPLEFKVQKTDKMHKH